MKKTLSDVHQMFALGFPDERIRPYAYLLSKRLEEGHVCIGLNEPLEVQSEIPFPVKGPDQLTGLARLIGQAGSGSPTPFVIDGARIYLQRYYNYESNIAGRLHKKMVAGLSKRVERKEALSRQRDLIRSLAADYPMEGLTEEQKTDWQLVGALTSLVSEFSIITGGPGTGKTTTLAKILRILYAMEPNSRVALAAPTGKAAQRMLESLKSTSEKYPAFFPPDINDKIHALKPSTLHRLLGFQRHSVNFKYGLDRPLEFDLIVVDETSMVDMPMFSKLLDAVGEGTRLVLLGDKDQLSSVEAGSLLGDLCQSVGSDGINGFGEELKTWMNRFIVDPERQMGGASARIGLGPLAGHIVELKLSHRFQVKGDIGKLSRTIIQGDLSGLEQMIDGPPSATVKFDMKAEDKDFDELVMGYADFIQCTDPDDALKKFNQLRVLVAVREGPQGLYAVNRRIEERLQAKGLIRMGKIFYHNRPVIVTKNNYELDLFNGDVGITREENGRAYVQFEGQDGEMRRVAAAYLTDCETVFAMTIHKSQGSEFGKVMVILPDTTDSPILTRELLYTGVTRAKDEVTIKAPRETILITTSQQVKRVSGIAERLQA